MEKRLRLRLTEKSYHLAFVTIRFKLAQPMVISAEIAEIMSLKIVISGLPIGCNAQVKVTSPNGYSNMQFIRGLWSAILGSLDPGTYALQAYNAYYNGVVFVPTQNSYAVTITPQTITNQTIQYSYQSTNPRVALSISVIGLPSEFSAQVKVTGPNGYSCTQNIAGGTTETLNGLNPGTYTLLAQQGVQGYWWPSQTSYSMTIAPQNSAFQILQYSLHCCPTNPSIEGGVSINIIGLPSTLSAQVNITGPSVPGQSSYISTEYIAGGVTKKLSAWYPGAYILQPQPVLTPGQQWLPLQNSYTVAITQECIINQDIKYS